MKYNIQVTGMSCQHCSMRVKKSLETLKGIQSVEVNLAEKLVSVTFDETQAQLKDIEKKISDTGYTVTGSQPA